LNIHRLSQLLGKIGEQEGKKWLESHDYQVYSFQEILWVIYDLECTINRLKRRRKLEYIEQDKLHINELESALIGVFGEKFGELRKFCTEFLLLKNEVERIRQANNFKRKGVGPDFIVTKDNDTFFIEVKVNCAELSKNQKTCFKIAKEHGFKTMVLRLQVDNNTSKDIQLTEFN
jgi:hypothetical protein